MTFNQVKKNMNTSFTPEHMTTSQSDQLITVQLISSYTILIAAQYLLHCEKSANPMKHS